MPAAIRKTVKNRPKRRTNSQPTQPHPVAPILIVDVEVSSPSLLLTFDQAVALDGLPDFGVDVGGGTVTQATQPAPNQVELVFSAAIVGATTVTIPFRDPAIRSRSGGYVTATSHVFA